MDEAEVDHGMRICHEVLSYESSDRPGEKPQLGLLESLLSVLDANADWPIRRLVKVVLTAPP